MIMQVTITALLTTALLVAPRAIAAASHFEQAVSEDVPVAGGIVALARAIGIDPCPDRARFVAELARLVYAGPRGVRTTEASPVRRLLAHLEVVDHAGPADLVPLALPAAVWSQAVFHRPLAPTSLFAAVMSDRSAALLAYGFAALDDETLRFFADHPAVITALYAHDADAFAAFAEHLQIRNDRVVPPGGDRAVPLWEAVLDERVVQPDRFARALFAKGKGRVAYLYDVIGHLPPPQAAFALGLWIEDADVRVHRFQALARAATSAFSEWHVTNHPFTRPMHDLVSLLSRVQADAAGRPGFPAWRTVWARAFDGADLPDELAPAGENKPDHLEHDALVDAAWLAEAVRSSDPRIRAGRLDELAFGQRAFAGAGEADLPDLLVALRAFSLFRMLDLTLERIGIVRPSVYAALARQARRLSDLDPVRGHAALGQFQGAIALVARLARVGTIDRATAETLLVTLGAVPLQRDGRYLGAVAEWLQSRLRPVLADDGDMEDVLVEALAGMPSGFPASLVSWEGRQYRFDPVMSEARRLRRIRERQGGPSIDLAIRNLAAIRQSADVSNARLADALFERVDVVLGEALLSLSYAVDLGDAEGLARMAGNLARRHDFGFAALYRDTRTRTAWAVPRQVFEPGEPWHVEGAALGLDVALAPLALRRTSVRPLTSAPALSTLERDTFTISLALMNPVALHDDARDAIAGAIARGEQRVETIVRGDDDVRALTREVAMDGWRARALEWTIRHDAQRAESLFSMTELLYLGGGGGVDLHPWGMASLASVGCICTRLTPPGFWTALIGRPQIGLIATTVADLHLRVAVVLHELRLPAAIAKSVLAAAVQDFVDQVGPSDADDWLTLVRTARGVTRERVEDYVAAATADGPLIPETGMNTRRVP